MKKIQKNKKGFTLIEMILVIAIIVILASVMVIAVGGYLNKANSAKAKVSSHNAENDSVSKIIDDEIAAAT